MNLQPAADYFAQALKLGAERYDAAIELAFQYVLLNRPAEAKDLLDRYRGHLSNSPIYLNLAGEAYTRMNLHADARPLFESACKLQPEVEMFSANLASCRVYLGDVDSAKAIYIRVLKPNPLH